MNGNANNPIGIDFSQYGALKKSGAFKLVHLAADTFNVVLRAFDQRTGTELKPTIVQCDQAGVKQQIQLLTDQIDNFTKHRAGLQQLLDEMKAAESQAKAPA